MNILKLFIPIMLLSLGYCKAQERSESIDPIKPSPYKIIRDTPYVTLPDSLGAGIYRGIAFIEGRIDSTLHISNIRIMKLQLETYSGEIFIDYYYGMDEGKSELYTDNAKRYLPFFKQYFNSLEIEENKEVVSENMNMITLPLKFK